MSLHRVVCVLREGVAAPRSHMHITHLGVGDEAGYRFLWAVEQVVQSIDEGERYVVSTSGDGLGGEDDLVDLVVGACPCCDAPTVTLAGGRELVDMPSCPPR